MIERMSLNPEMYGDKLPYMFILTEHRLPKPHWRRLDFYVAIESEANPDSIELYKMERSDYKNMRGFKVALGLSLEQTYRFCYVGVDCELGEVFRTIDDHAQRSRGDFEAKEGSFIKENEPEYSIIDTHTYYEF